MGTAYARSLRKYGLVGHDDLCLVVRSEAQRQRLEGIGRSAMDIAQAVQGATMVIVAVKPQDFAAVAPVLSTSLTEGQVLLSVMAGIPLDRLRRELGHRTLVRAMPNAPARIGMGITAYATATELSMRQTLMVEQLLNCTGRAVHLEDESLLDPVTALSGSGPAYFFHIVKVMVDAGTLLGLPPHVASALVKQTMLGSFHLLEHADQTPEELIKAVMSKGGTTEAAFKVFADGDLEGTLLRAITAACHRARELGREEQDG